MKLKRVFLTLVFISTMCMSTWVVLADDLQTNQEQESMQWVSIEWNTEQNVEIEVTRLLVKWGYPVEEYAQKPKSEWPKEYQMAERRAEKKVFNGLNNQFVQDNLAVGRKIGYTGWDSTTIWAEISDKEVERLKQSESVTNLMETKYLQCPRNTNITNFDIKGTRIADRVFELEDNASYLRNPMMLVIIDLKNRESIEENQDLIDTFVDEHIPKSGFVYEENASGAEIIAGIPIMAIQELADIEEVESLMECNESQIQDNLFDKMEDSRNTVKIPVKISLDENINESSRLLFSRHLKQYGNDLEAGQLYGVIHVQLTRSEILCLTGETGIKSVAVDEEIIIPGDVDGTNNVTLDDASIILKAALGISELNEAQKKAADMNSDGIITLDDARLVLRLALGIPESESAGR